jgi:wyosine [tRNA(Phe)-imidazoG37] synthetase (radical SAM superfamily)
LSFEKHVEGLVSFRKEYKGRLWVEVMLIHNLNDSEDSLTDLAAVLRRVRPDQVHLNLPIRPPCEPWVKPADNNGLMRAVAILGDVAKVVQPAEGDFDLSGFEDVVEAVLAIITRHPMRQEELVAALNHWSPNEVGEALVKLRKSRRAQLVTRFGQRFWSCARARYAGSELKRCHRNGKSLE